MRILTRRSKFLFVGLGVFLATYALLNYTDLRSSQFGRVIEGGELPDVHKHDHGLMDGHHHHHDYKNSEKTDKLKENQQTDTGAKNATETSGQKTHFLAYDGGGFSSVNYGVSDCGEGIKVEIVGSVDLAKTDFSYFHMTVPSKDSLMFKNKRHYSMVFTMESEPHSHGGETWKNADFRMWYNLDLSYPEPATYFDVRPHLLDLLSPPTVDFAAKEQTTNIAWIVSNCNAYNAREKYMKQLMSVMPVDSYGGCLKNKNSHPSEHMKGNIELFAKYKFVIAIENSNCQDYVTEKLVHAVASGSIPIVAGKDGKPDYLRFMPKGSYINLYDYKSPQELAKHLAVVAGSRQEYEKYIRFKLNHNYTREYMKGLGLKEMISLAKTVLDPSETFFSELVAKEKSENKLCKLAKYLHKTPVDVLDKEIEARRINRPSISEACLPSRNLERDLLN